MRGESSSHIKTQPLAPLTPRLCFSSRTRCSLEAIYSQFKSSLTALFHLTSFSKALARSRNWTVCTLVNTRLERHSHPSPAIILERNLLEISASFHERFQSTFPIPADVEATEALQNFSKAITSNLLGGVGYFYGTSIVDKGFAYEWDEEDDTTSASEDDDEDDASKPEKGGKLTEPKALLTATPSRSFFPRGFYWSVSSFGP